MKILILSFYYAPDLSAGSFRTSALVEQLARRNVQIEVITTMPNRYSSLKSDALQHETIDNVAITRLPIPSHNGGMRSQAWSFFRFYTQAIKIAKRNSYDLVYATSSRLFTALLGKRISKIHSIPLYLDIRDIFIDTLEDVLPPLLFRLSSPFLKRIEKYTFDNVHHINLVSKGFETYFLDKFNCKSYSFFTNGIDNDFIHYDYTNVEKKREVNILYAGNIGEGQALHNIIPCLAEMAPEIQFTIIGDGAKKEKLRKLCESLSNVHIKPPLLRKELKKEYKKADILFLHLNNYKAFEKVLPSKIFEYAATGKPILAGVAGYASQFIFSEVENTAIFSPLDENGAYNAINELPLMHSSRSEFITKFQRKSIMVRLSDSIINLEKSCEANDYGI